MSRPAHSYSRRYCYYRDRRYFRQSVSVPVSHIGCLSYTHCHDLTSLLDITFQSKHSTNKSRNGKGKTIILYVPGMPDSRSQLGHESVLPSRCLSVESLHRRRQRENGCVLCMYSEAHTDTHSSPGEEIEITPESTRTHTHIISSSLYQQQKRAGKPSLRHC